MKNITQDKVILRQKSIPVQSAQEAKEIIDQILPLFKDDKDKKRIGIAAIQIGINKTLAVIRNKEELFCLINPEIIEAEEPFIFYNEGCLSFPNLFRNTERYKHFFILNKKIENGNLVDEKLYFYYENEKNSEWNELLCIAVQHEIDHFNGKLIIDYDIKGETVTRKNNKVGRNDKCPCGSNKKFKKCCEGKEG